MFKKYLIPFLLIIPFLSEAQVSNIKSFTPDSVKFVQEITEIFVTARKKEGEEFMKKEFLPVFYSGQFSESDKDKLYKTCNIMLKKRMKPFPDFKNYLTSMMTFVTSTNLTDDSFEAWQRSLEKIIETSTSKKFGDFLTISGLLFSDKILFQSNTVTWVSSSNSYIFEYDSLPYIIFPSLDLKCYSKNDSAIIYNTYGFYYPTENKWIGKGGKIDWKRTGLEAGDVWAELGDYNINLKSSSYSVDSVKFYNNNYFDKPLLGKLEEKVQANVTEKNASYPRFDSYHKRFLIENIVEGVDYDGGFSMIGPKFVGSGNEEEDALLIFYREKQPFLISASKTFIIRKDKITSEKSAITIFLENDSIYHPGLNMKLLTKERDLVLYRDDKGIAKSPYYNTYHNIDMDVEVINWNLDEPLMNMGVLKGSSQTKARFESSNYYSYIKYQKIMGMDAVHPLVLIKEVSKKFQDRELMADDIARYMRMPMDQVGAMLLNLSTQGFISYNIEKQKVIVKEKLFWYLESNAQKRDYDVIEFNSDIAGKPNATLNLLNFDISMRGVSQIFLSDSQNVYIRPSEQSITMKKNRDFLFGGSVHAGFFDFFGKEFSFEYDEFKINLITVDSLAIKVRAGEKDIYGKSPLVRVKTVIEDIHGDLLIDGPSNKSGNQSLKHYPILNSRQESYVYYNRYDIQKGAYSKDEFYFKVNPFTFDSLNAFRNEDLRFAGLFVSAGIFPDFEENLTLQSDYSLGFIRKTPPGGYKIYGDKAVFENDIKMSHEGLRGDGVINYITSTAYSDNFIFYPDSINAIMQNYVIREQKDDPEYPEVNAQGAYLHYLPYQDLMQVDKKAKPISMFKGQAESHGSLFLQPSGLTGKGLMTFAKAEMDADLYKYKNNEFLSDTADFRLASLSSSEFALKTNNVNAHVNFNERKAKFLSNGGGSKLEFPVNQYVCYMDQFTWFMDQENIEMSGGGTAEDHTGRGDLDLTGSQFISTHPKQDSLTYFSSATKYDLKEYIIHSSNVKYFNAADAMIYPGDGKVTVERKAKMRTLDSAKIVTNYITKYHTIFNATVNVYGRKSYSAFGDYNYVDENDMVQVIHFNDIKTDTTGQTIAEGLIDLDKEENAFTLSPNFDFKGKAKLFANNEFLTFEGNCRIQHSCDKVSRNWMKFQSEINPKGIFIPVSSEPLNDDNTKMASGIMVTNDSIGLYSAFLSRKIRPSDSNVLTSDGFLFFDKVEREYKISSKEKLNEFMLHGNYMSLNVNDCKCYGEGKMDIGTDLGNIKVDVAGNGYHTLINNEAYFDVLMTMNFFIDESAMEKMAEHLQKSSSAGPINYSRPTFEKSLKELLGKETADKLISQLSLHGQYRRFPSELNQTLVITDMKLKWHEEVRAFRSMGEIGIGNIFKTQLNKKYNGHFEIQKKRGGDIWNFYVEMEGGVWYYFNYHKNILQLVSSNEEFNNSIKSIKSDKRKYKNQKGEPPFQYTISTVRKKNDFLKRMEMASEGEKE
jgi:hypothetical protein